MVNCDLFIARTLQRICAAEIKTFLNVPGSLQNNTAS